jgi:hypothetical protein
VFVFNSVARSPKSHSEFFRPLRESDVVVPASGANHKQRRPRLGSGDIKIDRNSCFGCDEALYRNGRVRRTAIEPQ